MLAAVSATETLDNFAASAARSGDGHGHDMMVDGTSHAPPEEVAAAAAAAATNNESLGKQHHGSARPPSGTSAEAHRAADDGTRRRLDDVGSAEGRVLSPHRHGTGVDSAPDDKETNTNPATAISSSGSCSDEDHNGGPSASSAAGCAAVEDVVDSPLLLGHDERSGLSDDLRGEGITTSPVSIAKGSSSNGNGNGSSSGTYPSSVPRGSADDDARRVTREHQYDGSSQDVSGTTEGVAGDKNNNGSSSPLLDAAAIGGGGEEHFISPRGNDGDSWAPYEIVAEADPVTSWEVLRQVRKYGVTVMILLRYRSRVQYCEQGRVM